MWPLIAAVLAVGAVNAGLGFAASILGRKRGERAPVPARAQPGPRTLFVTGCLLGLAAYPLVRTLSLSRGGLFLALLGLYYCVGFLLSAIEAIVFSSGPSPIRARDLLGALVMAGLCAGTATLVMSPAASGSLLGNLERWFELRGVQESLLRLALAAVAYMVAYCVIGSITWHFVRPYYEDPRYGLALRVPGARVILPMQLARGLGVTLMFLPFIAATSSQGVHEYLLLSSALALTAGVVPLVSAVAWPTFLRVAHGIEIVVFAFVFGFALWRLLGS